MLFKKTLKVASATALWMVALLGANSAMAQVVLPTYSAESLEGTGPVYALESAADDLSATVPMNDRVAYYLREASEDDPAFIRVGATGVLRFTGAPTVSIAFNNAAGDPQTPVSAGTAVPVAGEGAGYRYMRDGTNTIDGTVTGIVVTLPDNDTGADANVAGPGVGGVMVAVYDEQADAHFGEGTPYGSGSMNLVRVASSVQVGAALTAPAVNTASAASRFTSIAGLEAATAPYEISLGGFNITVDGTHLDASDGATLDSKVDETATPPVTLWSQAGVNGGTRFYGDGGWDFAHGFRLAGTVDGAVGAASCTDPGPDGSAAGPQEGNGAGIASSPLSEEDPTDDVMTNIKRDPWVLCVTISNENEETIPAGSYYVDVNLMPARGDLREFPPMGMAGILTGRIRHDGTTVQIPYVTSYDGYTQRIVIVNRNKVDVRYALTFRSEGDGEIMGDNPHEGMAMADQATVIKVADLVTLSNPTRAAATLTVAAKSSSIDVATTMVNKMDQSTDTVVLDHDED